MKKHLLLKSNILVISFILICFFSVIYTNSSYYQKLTEEHMETVVQMANTDISRQLENSLNKEVAVAKSMANNTYLQDWFDEEQANLDDEKFMKKMYQYLKTYQEAYGYTTVFCVSAGSLNYYYQDGLNKTLTKGNEHDIWYFNFLDLNQEYDIQLDTDQVNNNIPTIFVNYRMNDENGRLLGVLGVAVELTDVQKEIDTYADSYGLSIYLINRGGARNSFSQNEKYFVNEDEIADKLGVKEFKLQQSDERMVYWYDNQEKARECIIDSYMSFLKWNVIVSKDTTPLINTFAKRIKDNLLICLTIVLGCIIVTTTVFLQYDKNKKYLENIDELTGIPNRKIFIVEVEKRLKRRGDKQYTLIMMDIDNFKNFNDTKGHLYGNVILNLVGNELKTMTGPQELAARWGGDEFIGLMEGSAQETKARFLKLQEQLGKLENNEKITISIGIIEIQGNLKLTEYMELADKAMYQAKHYGKNTSVIL